MSLEEKITWGAFLPWVLGCGYYLIALLRWNEGGSHWPIGRVLMGTLLLQVAYMIVVASVSSKEPRDERTRLIEYKGYKVAYLAVMAGVEAIRMETQLVLYRAGVRA